MIILGVNKSNHDGSVALLRDTEVLFHVQEERLNNIKHDASIFTSLQKVKDYVDHIDILAVSARSRAWKERTYSDEMVIQDAVRSLGLTFFDSSFKTYDFSENHHEMHASTAFYNSGFKEALCIVIDGKGSGTIIDGITHFERTTSFYMSYPHNVVTIQQSRCFDEGGAFHSPTTSYNLNETVYTTNVFSEAAIFEDLSLHYGLGHHGAGKVMGMSSYGVDDTRFPSLYANGELNNTLWMTKICNRSPIFEGYLPDDFQTRANLAYRVQQDTQEHVSNYILNMLEKTGQKNLCLSGGFFLNCVSNYHLLKKLPKGVSIYVEPMSTDDGNALGSAKTAYYLETKSKNIVTQNSIYYGLTYNYTLEDIRGTDYEINVTAEDVAKLLADKKIVALYQGRSEAGPRALGNRSILYDPRDPNGKDHVNAVKKREWYRPFAGTVLKEKAKDWFNMLSLDESPYMMYAVDVIEEKKTKIPAITHVDGTCRVQTLSREQNPFYYDLIKSFDDITGVPIVFNTSFNLAGNAIVETLTDALQTLRESDIDYLYLPELNALVKGRNK
jgi:carbamoyltransferase